MRTLEEEECWGSSSKSNFVPEQIAEDSDCNVSLVEEGDGDLHSAEEMDSSKRYCNKRKRVPDEGNKRYKRHRAIREGVMLGD